MDVLAIARAIVGAVLLLYLPGRAWVSILIPNLSTRIERFAFSVALSVSALVLALYLGNVLAGVKVNALNAVLWSLGVTATGFGLHGALRYARTRSPRRAGE